ncbi:hypothetical protein B7C42_06523 [Nocardia cerradoensis]|uniref:Uncharacterized protein n=1 Tax=Nocardia cerradoensis TaxID=85688 RepID=A0A231GXP5_9NOCA|nr:hypothetical protein B7C42_06523 [Nocardia cerradoensis]
MWCAWPLGPYPVGAVPPVPLAAPAYPTRIVRDG